jgi:transposase-like protein
MAKGESFAPEFRREWVRLYRVSGQPLGAVAEDLGVAPESLRRWVLQARGRRRPGAGPDERVSSEHLQAYLDESSSATTRRTPMAAFSDPARPEAGMPTSLASHANILDPALCENKSPHFAEKSGSASCGFTRVTCGNPVRNS